MSTFEKLFVRIFERKRWIVDQLKQHSELYDQSLASKCLIEGIQPPSWLLTSGFEGGSADFKELKKEDLISGFLFPPPRPNYLTAAGHNRPLFSENNVQDSDTLFTGTCASEKDLDVRDCSILVPNFHLDEAITSPHQTLATLSDTNSQLDTSRAKIQRSRSREKTRIYDEVKSEKKRRESYRCAIAGRTTRSKTSGGLHSETLASQKSFDAVDSIMQMSERQRTVSPPHQTEARFSDINSQLANSLERIQRSRPTHTIPALLNNEELQSEKKRKESCSSSISGRSRRSRTSSGLRTDAYAHTNSSDVGVSSILVSECHRNEAIASPPLQAVARVSDTNSQLDKSVARIQRSSSRQKSPVLLNNEVKSEKNQESYKSAIAGRLTRSKTSSGLSTDTHASQRSSDAGDSSMLVSRFPLSEATASPPHQTEARFSDIYSQLDNYNSLEKIQGSRSKQMAPVLLNNEEVQSEKKRKESCSSVIGGRITGSRISSGLPTDTLAHKKSFDAGDSSMQVSECHQNEAITSLPYQTVARLSDFDLQLDESLARIQRSSSREKSPVLLTTEEGKLEEKRNESHSSAVAARITRSSGLRTDACVSKKSFDEGDISLQATECNLHEEIVSPPRQTEARFSDVNSELDSSLVRIQRSRSRQKALVLRSSVEVQSEKKPSGSQPRADVNRDILNLDIDPVNISFGETSARTLDVENHQVKDICAGELDVGANIVSIASNELGAYVCDEKSISPDLNRVANSSLHQTYDIPSRDYVPGYSDASDGGIKTILSETITPKPAHIDTMRESPYLLMNSMEPVNEDAIFMSDESSLDMKSLPSGIINSNAPENSWPQCKRRKIEDRSTNVFTTSPILKRAERLNKIDRNCIFEVHRRVQHDLVHKHFSKSADVEASQLDVSDSPDARLSRSAKRPRTSRYGHSPTLETKEGDQDMEDREDARNISMELTQTWLETSPGSRLKNDCENAQENALGSTYINPSLLTTEGLNSPFPKSELNSQKTEKRGPTGKNLQDTESVIEDWLLSSSVRSLNFEDLDLNAANQSIPVFEGFSMDMPTEKISSLPGDRISLSEVDLPSSTSERISVLERLCRYTSVHPPLSDSPEPKNHSIPDVYPCTPNGLLDGTDMGNDVPLSQLKSNYILASAEPDRASYSGCMPSLDVEMDLGIAKPPCTPPFRMLGLRITSVEKPQTINPELMCFRIDEDNCTSEENGSLDEVADTFNEDRSPRECSSSSHRKPLVDMTNSETLMSMSVSKTVHDRGSIDSVNTEPYRPQINAKKNLRNTYGQSRRGRMDKENTNSSVSGNSYSMKTRVSRKASSENNSQSLVGNKGSKRGNIVSNVSSFVPLVQQKQKPPAFATGKRDVKVKALEAAEAAKRLEEKRENDRKMKKVAAKLERARLEEVKLKQLELKQKKEVEERKKKEAEMAARKRLREEDDRKETERKRKCTEEARKDKKDHYKIRADKEKELRRRAADVREGKEIFQNIPKTVNAGTESVPQTISQGSEAVKDYSEKVVSNAFEDDASNRLFLLSEGNDDLSYDISPYQVSDDEEEEVDEDLVSRKKKFIPSWAREKSLASIMPYMERVDPCKIFLPTRVSSISTVLSSLRSLK